MKRLGLITLLLGWVTCFLGAQETVSLNGTWLFRLAENESEATRWKDFYQPTFQGKGFDEIPVPSNWAVLGYEEPTYRGFKEDKASEGFYLRDFDTPEGFEDKRVLLHFGGVWASAEVWLNGAYIGTHDGGYNSFAFDVTGKLQEKGKNRLAVRVKQVSRSYKFDTFDDWTLGGIYRDVTLESMPAKRWIDQVVTQTDFDSDYEDACLRVRVMVGDKHKETLPGNYPSPGEPYVLRFTLTDAEGNTVLSQETTVPAHVSTGREIYKDFQMEKPHPWTAETPYLYDLRVELLEKGQASHVRQVRVGFREISTEGGVFRINGQAVKLRGVNRHDEYPDVGRATTREQWEQDIRLMKEANINYVRAAHYPHAKGFVELCDELGMYVGGEVSMGGAGNQVYDPALYDAALQRAYETVVRDQNSPSVIYWSVGNEDPLSSMHMASVKLVKALDPTRPVLLPWRHETWLPREIDILAPHYWAADEYDSLAAHADRPIITTEYTHAYGEIGMGGLKERWRGLTRHPAGAGAAIWMWADQGIKTPVRNPAIKRNDQNKGDLLLRIDGAGWDGIVDSYRRPTPDFWEAKAVYAPIYPVKERVSFVPGQRSVPITVQNDFDFTNLGSIRIGWSLWKDGERLDTASTTLQAIPHASARLTLPADKLGEVESQAIYYYRLTFHRPDGSVLGCNSVELVTEGMAEAVDAGQDIQVEEEELTAIRVGQAKYVFSPKTGMLVSASQQEHPVVQDIEPVIWHRLDISDRSIIGKKNLPGLPDMTHFTPTVRTWKVDKNNREVTIRTEVDYQIDASNRFSVSYTYTVDRQGVLSVNYQLEPHVQVPYLPLVGMKVQTVGAETLHWLGLGPHDAYPNKRSAGVLGLWGGRIDSPEAAGMKEVKRIECVGRETRLHITTEGYMEHRADKPDCLSVLTDVLGRPEKGRKSDPAIQQLSTSGGRVFAGNFRIQMIP